MANPQVVQHSDFSVEFDIGSYKLNNAPVNLASVSDMIFSISETNPVLQPILKKLLSVVPADFTVDNVNNKVTVLVRSTEIGLNIDTYYCNLWLVQSGSHIGHVPQAFDLVAASSY